MSRDGRVDLTLVTLHDAVDQRDVRLLDASLLELGRETAVRGVGIGHDHQARGVLVQPVHDAGAQGAADARQVRHHRQQGVDQRAVRVAGTRMHRQARGLVDHQELRVLVDDRDGNVLRNHIQRDRRRHGHDHIVAGAHGGRWLGDRAVQRDPAVAHQRGAT